MNVSIDVPLSKLPSGAKTVVRRLDVGSTATRRLASMGVVVGSSIEVLQNRRHGPMLILVRDTRLALGRGEAGKIYVEPEA